jgi:hypothetical protein
MSSLIARKGFHIVGNEPNAEASEQNCHSSFRQTWIMHLIKNLSPPEKPKSSLQNHSGTASLGGTGLDFMFSLAKRSGDAIR